MTSFLANLLLTYLAKKGMPSVAPVCNHLSDLKPLAEKEMKKCSRGTMTEKTMTADGMAKS
jgi:hypothetical protein